MLLLTCSAFGVLGHGLRAIPFVAALLPALIVLALTQALSKETSWYGAIAFSYVALALAQLSYLATVCLRERLTARLVGIQRKA